MPSSRVRAPARIGAALTATLTAGAVAAALAACADAAHLPTAPVTGAANASLTTQANGSRITHVLLLSVDGMHQADLARYVRLYPTSALAQLAGSGITYTNAATSRPSDSFPGLLSMVTGGSPRVTGVYYDDSYDRRLAAPGSDCSTRGTEIVYDESIDRNPDALDGGGGIDPTKLPRDPDRGCTPVYPHQFLRVNTVFEVIRTAGLRTAWSDKHPAYDLVNGPSGHGVDDLYTPEIASHGGVFTADVADAEHYDDRKVKAVLNEIEGHDHTGAQTAPVPAILGMNFQAVSVGEKTAGYTDAAATPTAALADALARTDASIGQMLAALDQQGIRQQTLVILTAKHGQAPIDPSTSRLVNKKLVPGIVNGVAPGLVAQSTEDDVALLWLTDQARTQAVANALSAAPASVGVGSVLSGAPLIALFGNPATDSRTPDVIVRPVPGVIYAGASSTKRAEHGGFSDDDVHVPILLSVSGIAAVQVSTPVTTTQIAPTILTALGLNPQALDAVRLEGTPVLPSTTTVFGQRATPGTTAITRHALTH